MLLIVTWLSRRIDASEASHKGVLHQAFRPIFLPRGPVDESRLLIVQSCNRAGSRGRHGSREEWSGAFDAAKDRSKTRSRYRSNEDHVQTTHGKQDARRPIRE